MSAASLPRKFVVEFPDDDNASLEAMIAIAGGGGTILWLGEWLLRFSNDVAAVHARLAFSHLQLTADWRFIVPDVDRYAVESWCSLNAGGAERVWVRLEVVEPWSRRAARDWAAAYHLVLSERPRLRSGAHWPHIVQ
jgi:hypothetical protein